MVKLVFFAVLPDVVLLDIAGAAEAFRIANQQIPDSYRLAFVGPVAEARSAVGLNLNRLARLPAQVPDGSLIVITGVASDRFDIDSPATRTLSKWLAHTMENETATLLCVCTGSLIAAAAGLLKGRACTTHHNHIEMLASLEPDATVHDNRIFVEDGNVFTSAGVTAGTDLALHVIGRELGYPVAAAVARDLVLYMRRSGSDAQLSPWVMHRNHLHPAIHRVQDAVARNPAKGWSAAQLAALACTSARNLARLFAEHAGCSPLDYVQRLRVALARELIANTDAGLERIAEKSGFSSAHQLRRVWRRWETAPPSTLREQPRAG